MKYSTNADSYKLVRRKTKLAMLVYNLKKNMLRNPMRINHELPTITTATITSEYSHPHNLPFGMGV